MISPQMKFGDFCGILYATHIFEVPAHKGDYYLKKFVLIAAGVFFLLLGGIGIAIPIVPTTPFILLASGCFASSSPALYTWLANTKYFGEFIVNYKTKVGVRKSVKIKALVFLYCTLGLSFFLVSFWHLRLVLLVVAFGVTVHILMIKTKSS